MRGPLKISYGLRASSLHFYLFINEMKMERNFFSMGDDFKGKLPGVTGLGHLQ